MGDTVDQFDVSPERPGPRQTRRAFLRLLGVGAAGSLLAACAPAVQPSPTAAPAGGAAAPPAAKPTAAPAAAPTAAPAAKAPVKGGKATYVIGSGMKTKDPHKLSAMTEGSVLMHVFEGLTRLMPDGVAAPLLAEKWESTDGKTWTFHLRKGVKFHDGTPFNAKAVVATFNRVLDPKNVMPARGNLFSLKEAKEVDEYTVQLITSEVFGALPLVLGHQTSLMLGPDGIAKWGEDLGNRDIVGTGPFRITKFTPGEELVVERNPNYWGTPPNLDQITFKIISEGSTLVAQLMTGEADIAFYVPNEMAARAQGEKSLEIVEVPSVRMFMAHMNIARPEFKDARTRTALNHAVDKQAIIKSLYGGFGKEADSGISPGFFGYKATKTFPYNPQLSEQLLGQAGWTKGSDGVLQKGGQPFAVTLRASKGRYPKDAQLAEALAGYLQKVGIKVTLQVEEWATFWDGVRAKEAVNTNSIVQAAWGHPSQDGGIMLSQTYHSKPTVGIYNFGFFNNPEVDTLADETMRSTDPTRRLQLIDQAVQKVLADPPAIYLLSATYLVGKKKALKGIVLHPGELHTIRDAWLDPSGS